MEPRTLNYPGCPFFDRGSRAYFLDTDTERILLPIAVNVHESIVAALSRWAARGRIARRAGREGHLQDGLHDADTRACGFEL